MGRAEKAKYKFTKCEYWAKVSDIKVPEEYRGHEIGQKKWERKLKYWKRNGRFQSPIIVDRDFVLVDGYSSIRIAETEGLERVPVYFMDGDGADEDIE